MGHGAVAVASRHTEIGVSGRATRHTTTTTALRGPAVWRGLCQCAGTSPGTDPTRELRVYNLSYDRQVVSTSPCVWCDVPVTSNCGYIGAPL